MNNKTCGQCRFLIPEYDRHGRGRCYYTDNRYLPSCGACKAFVERYGGNQPTNGDVIRQGGNRALAAFQQQNTCLNCAYYNSSVMHHEFCDCPQDKDCVDGVEAWLNAPADCVAKNGESAKQMD